MALELWAAPRSHLTAIAKAGSTRVVHTSHLLHLAGYPGNDADAKPSASAEPKGGGDGNHRRECNASADEGGGRGR